MLIPILVGLAVVFGVAVGGVLIIVLPLPRSVRGTILSIYLVLSVLGSVTVVVHQAKAAVMSVAPGHPTPPPLSPSPLTVPTNVPSSVRVEVRR